MAASGQKALYTLEDIIGESQVMREVKRTAARVARSDAAVMVWGETGTGKELLVQAIHSASQGRAARFPSELRRHAREPTPKAYFSAPPGRVHRGHRPAGANGNGRGRHSLPGRNRLDAHGAGQDAPRQSGEKGARLGDTRERPVGVRFIASTSVPPAQAVKARLLRADLYYRLSLVEIGLPRLRDRREDIPLSGGPLPAQACK